jgi:hypothetical protein
MPKKKIISDDIREQVAARVEAFNQATVRPPAEPSALVRFLRRIRRLPPTADSPPPGSCIPRFRGAFLYLDRIGFDGRPYQKGTMRAGLAAYPA